MLRTFLRTLKPKCPSLRSGRTCYSSVSAGQDNTQYNPDEENDNPRILITGNLLHNQYLVMT